MTVELPDKRYFKIGEVAKFAEVATHVIRYWESEFDQIKPKRANSRQRLFRREDVLLLLQIKDLLHNKGYTISGARKFLTSGLSDPEEVNNKPASSNTAIVGKEKPGVELVEMKKELLAIRDILAK